MMSTILLYLTVSALMPLLARSNDLPPLPRTGVRLYGGYNDISYPNNSMIPANHFYRDNTRNDGLNDTLWCQSAKNEDDIGVWYYPNGTQVSTVDDSSPLYSTHMLGQIGLYHDVWLNNSEGIYRCVIQDECNVNQTIIIALYNTNTYKNNRGPKIIETTFKSLLSTRDDSSFLISFIVTNGTATYINCTLNDTLIYPNITQIILSYQLPIKILVELLFQSRDEGWYNCSVSNSRVEDKYYNGADQAYPAHNDIYVKVAKKPLNVTAKWINSSEVLITWSPPVNNNPLIDRYEVFYDVNHCDYRTFSVGVTNNTELIISGLCNSQNYSFFVVLYSNEEHTLPSEWSDVTTLIAVTPSVNETPSSESCTFEEILSSLPVKIGAGFLLFTNLISFILFILSCLCLLRSRRKHKKIVITEPQREYTEEHMSSRDGTTVESELNDKNLQLRDNENKDDIGSHVYAVVDKKKGNGSKPAQPPQNSLQPIYSMATAIEMNYDEMTVQLSEYANVDKD